MATLSYKGKKAQGFSSLILKDNKVIADGNIFTVNKNERLRVEVHGTVKQLRSNNCCKVKGDIYRAEVGNSIVCDGFVQTCLSDHWSGSRVNVDRDAFVFFGREADYWNALKVGFTLSKKRATVLRIDGALAYLDNSLGNIECNLEVHGNVMELMTTNCLFVRGKVLEAKVGNICSATMGVGKRPNPKLLYEQHEAETGRFMSDIDNLFKGIKF